MIPALSFQPRYTAQLKASLEQKIRSAGRELEAARHLPLDTVAGSPHLPTLETLELIDRPLLNLALYADGRVLLEHNADQEIAETRWADMTSFVLTRARIAVPSFVLPGHEEQQIKTYQAMCDRRYSLDGRADRLWGSQPLLYAHLLNVGRIALTTPQEAAFRENF